MVWELLSYANMIYRRVYAFQHLDEFAESFREDPPDVYWNVLQYERLIDQIKICIAFENYNKAKLLQAGYLVHVIGQKKNRALASRQKLGPVTIKEFLQHNSFVQDENSKEWHLEGFANFSTVSFSLTLQDSYQSIIGLESFLLNHLKNINPKRNRLHFYKNYAGAFRVETFIENLRQAKIFGTELLVSELKKASSALNFVEELD